MSHFGDYIWIFNAALWSVINWSRGDWGQAVVWLLVGIYAFSNTHQY